MEGFGEAASGVRERFWSSYPRKDVLATQGVTGLVPVMVGLLCEERLSRLGLYCMEFRRMRGNLIKMHKITKGLDKQDTGRMVPLAQDRRHILRVSGRH